jgi:hypothetical protein
MTAVPSVLALLRAGVPLSLLADLLEPGGPDSREIARREGCPRVVVVTEPVAVPVAG